VICASRSDRYLCIPAASCGSVASRRPAASRARSLEVPAVVRMQTLRKTSPLMTEVPTVNRDNLKHQKLFKLGVRSFGQTALHFHRDYAECPPAVLMLRPRRRTPRRRRPHPATSSDRKGQELVTECWRLSTVSGPPFINRRRRIR